MKIFIPFPFIRLDFVLQFSRLEEQLLHLFRQVEHFFLVHIFNMFESFLKDKIFFP